MKPPLLFFPYGDALFHFAVQGVLEGDEGGGAAVHPQRVMVELQAEDVLGIVEAVSFLFLLATNVATCTPCKAPHTEPELLFTGCT